MNNPTTEYSFFSKKEFNQLADKHDNDCISIYIPTHRAGKKVNEGHGKLLLKNCLQDISTELKQYKHSDIYIKELLSPAESLLEDHNFWRNQSDGLAIFLNKGDINYYTLPLHFETYTYISNHFYLKPLIPFFNGDGKFYLLKLTQREVALFEVSRHSITEIDIKDLAPINMAEIKDHDNEQKNLQNRSGHDSGNKELFHGHGLGKDSHNKDLMKFFKAIDDGIINLINDKEAPLVLACQDQYYPIYSKITSYPHLYDEFISGNPADEDPLLLHEKAWQLLKENFQQYKKNKIAKFQNLLNSEKASSDTEEIICGAIEGRIDTLFIQASKEIYGLYDKENRTLIIDKEKDIRNASLVNLTAIRSFTQGANTYLVYPDKMPLKGTTMNAIFRY